MSALPSSWIEPPISDVADVNPGKEVNLTPFDLVSFVPMAAVDEVSGTILSPVDRPYGDVSKGFTHFRDNDVIFAKITPSMENGKSAVARGLTNGTGIGSTEFHVFRSNGAIDPDYLWRFVRQKSFRENAQAVMSGAVGQQRVPANYLKNHRVPLPPLPEQRRIVKKVDGLTARTARARKELDCIPTLIARYKQRLLALAFSGEKADNWPKKLIAEISTLVTSGSRGWARYYSSEGDMFVRVGNVRRSDIDLDLSDVQSVKPPAGAEGSRTELKKGDVLVTITADLGRVGVFDSAQTAYVNQHVALVRLDDPSQSRFVAWYLSSDLGQGQLLANNRGATKAGLGLGDIRGVSIPFPEFEEQAQIVRRIESAFRWLDRVAADHAATVRLLPKLDAAIFAKAFRGELVAQNPKDEPAEALLERIKAERQAKGRNPKSGPGRKPNRAKAQVMIEKPLPPRDRLMNDSEKWPADGLPFEAIAMRNPMPHDALRDALFELLSGASPALQQRFDSNAEVIVIQRVAA